MLCNGKRSQSTIKNPPGSGNQTLVHQKLAVHKPDSWHLVHEDQGSFERVIHVIISGISNAATSHLEEEICGNV